MLIAIDPGSTGAIAWLSDDGALIRVEDLPIAKIKVGKTLRSRLLPAALMEMIAAARPVHAFLEEVQPMGTNGSIANFSLGKSAGLIEGVLAGMRIPLTLVRPKDWQKHYAMTGGDKGASRARAMQLWPGASASFIRVKDDGRAEAALIGLWGAHRMQGMDRAQGPAAWQMPAPVQPLRGVA